MAEAKGSVRLRAAPKWLSRLPAGVPRADAVGSTQQLFGAQNIRPQILSSSRGKMLKYWEAQVETPRDPVTHFESATLESLAKEWKAKKSKEGCSRRKARGRNDAPAVRGHGSESNGICYSI